ncbi:MAG TPA: GntR family transcriptional regulator [Firmicutes bacterium]|nr:GntR family transcriptional regulator [Bacillota bacterium]
MNIDFNTAFPIYLQIIEEFKRQIAVGALKPGEKLPSQRDLAARLKVNANTVQRVYREMELLGLVDTLRGQGTFIREDAALVEQMREEMLANLIDDFIQAMQALDLQDAEIISLLESRLNRGDR